MRDSVIQDLSHAHPFVHRLLVRTQPCFITPSLLKRCEQVRREVLTLPHKERVIFYRICLGHTSEQIAHSIGESPEAVKNIFSNTVTNLHARLEIQNAA